MSRQNLSLTYDEVRYDCSPGVVWSACIHYIQINEVLEIPTGTCFCWFSV